MYSVLQKHPLITWHVLSSCPLKIHLHRLADVFYFHSVLNNTYQMCVLPYCALHPKVHYTEGMEILVSLKQND